jgi:hypothetical protein
MVGVDFVRETVSEFNSMPENSLERYMEENKINQQMAATKKMEAFRIII